MEFGKADNINLVTFKFANDDPANLSVLPTIPHKNPQIFLGCPVWKSKDWIGTLYPKSAKENQFLHYYSRQFNSIELNTTHYQIPDKATVLRWAAQTPEGFCFSPKIYKGISHSSKLANVCVYTIVTCKRRTTDNSTTNRKKSKDRMPTLRKIKRGVLPTHLPTQKHHI